MPNNDGRMGFAIPLSPEQLRQMTGEPERPRQPVIAQVMDLQTIFDQSNQQTPWHPGELVRERQGMGFLSAVPPVMIVMRVLDKSDKMQRHAVTLFSARVPLVRPDVLVAYKDEDGDLRIVPHEGWRLEAYDGERPA